MCVNMFLFMCAYDYVYLCARFYIIQQSDLVNQRGKKEEGGCDKIHFTSSTARSRVVKLETIFLEFWQPVQTSCPLSMLKLPAFYHVLTGGCANRNAQWRTPQGMFFICDRGEGLVQSWVIKLGPARDQSNWEGNAGHFWEGDLYLRVFHIICLFVFFHCYYYFFFLNTSSNLFSLSPIVNLSPLFLIQM